jgi:hypothetical protein
MDPVKIVIFVAAFLLLILLGRKLTSRGESYASTLPPEAFRPKPIAADDDGPGSSKPAIVGADLPFPVNVPEIERDVDGKYNRPEFLNYYFETIDLHAGPEDPESFCDDFYIAVRDIESNRPMLYSYLVATPAGLQKVLNTERLPSLYLEGQALIVPRWNLPLILDAAVKQIMKDYAVPDDKETHALPNDDV